jgi:hypothetical protein
MGIAKGSQPPCTDIQCKTSSPGFSFKETSVNDKGKMIINEASNLRDDVRGESGIQSINMSVNGT